MSKEPSNWPEYLRAVYGGVLLATLASLTVAVVAALALALSPAILVLGIMAAPIAPSYMGIQVGKLGVKFGGRARSGARHVTHPRGVPSDKRGDQAA